MSVTVREKEQVVISRKNGGAVETPAAAPEVEASAEITAEDIKANLSAQVEQRINQLIMMGQPEVAEPLNWWDLYGFGPYQVRADTVPPSGLLSSPLLPHQVIRAGERAFLATVVVINPNPLPQDPLIRPTDILTGFKLPLSIHYSSLNATSGRPAQASLNVKRVQNLEPGISYYVDVLEFVAEEPGCVIETNICARILDCYQSRPSASPFAGFATWMYNPDNESFLAGFVRQTNRSPGFTHNDPIRFMVYE